MGLPYENEDYDEGGGASTINDLGGMNFSPLNDNEIMKRVDANNVGGTKILTTATPVISNISINTSTYRDGDDNLISSITHVKDDSIPGNTIHRVNILPNASQSQFLTVLHSQADAECKVGINVTDPEETLDIEGNLQLRSGAQGKIFFKHPSGLQKVELDGNQDGTNGGKFIVKTKVNNGSMTQKLEVNNAGAIGLGATPDYGTAGQVLKSNGSGSGVSWVTPTTNNYAQTVDGTSNIKVGNQSTAFFNNNTLDQWLPLYDQTNNQKLFKTITLNDPTRPVRIDANVKLLYKETTVGFRILCSDGTTSIITFGSQAWRQSTGTNDNDTSPYTCSIIHVHNGGANLTFTVECYVMSNSPSANPYFFINPTINPIGTIGTSTLLLTEL
jgi:hypothetical protein